MGIVIFIEEIVVFYTVIVIFSEGIVVFYTGIVIFCEAIIAFSLHFVIIPEGKMGYIGVRGGSRGYKTLWESRITRI